jgi:hypothetical protein
VNEWLGLLPFSQHAWPPLRQVVEKAYPILGSRDLFVVEKNSKEYFFWHTRLQGRCEASRKHFVSPAIPIFLRSRQNSLKAGRSLTDIVERRG